MSKCHISYKAIPKQTLFDPQELKKLSLNLKNLKPLNLTLQEQIEESQKRLTKMSIQGVQTKLSAKLRIQKECFDIVDIHGNFILKPQGDYPELPQNEALTMRLARTVGIDVPVSGLIPGKDGSLCYFVKRFDRHGANKKYDLEDFAQLSLKTRESKYDSSVEEVVKIIAQYTSFPIREYPKFFKLFLFNYLIGNEDMHLKNYSLITKKSVVELSPAYDLLNSTIALKNPQEETALPLKGKKSKLTKNDIFKYLAIEILNLNPSFIKMIKEEFIKTTKDWDAIIEDSFLSPEMKDKYKNLLNQRLKNLLLI